MGRVGGTVGLVATIVGLTVGSGVEITVGLGSGAKVGLGLGKIVGFIETVGVRVAEGVAEKAGKKLSPAASTTKLLVTCFSTPFTKPEIVIVCVPGVKLVGTL